MKSLLVSFGEFETFENVAEKCFEARRALKNLLFKSCGLR